MSYVLEVLPALLNGAVVTLQVFFIVIVLSIPLGIVLAFLMQIKFKPLNWLLTLYVWIMRGTPLLLQLIFVYYVLPSVGIVFDRLPAAILAFTLNYAAYFAEIFRGGILAIPKGQSVLPFPVHPDGKYVSHAQVWLRKNPDPCTFQDLSFQISPVHSRRPANRNRQNPDE